MWKNIVLIGASALAIAALGISQEARILIVEKSDSQTLAAAYKDYKAAQKRWEDLKIATAKKYTPTDEKGKVSDEWKTIQFSADFRAIVPADSQYASLTGCAFGYNYWPYANSGTVLTGSNVTSSIPAAGTLTSNSTSAKVNPDLFVDNSVVSGLTTVEPKNK